MENEVKKPNSPCPNNDICAKNFDWLAENLKGVDESVKEIVVLIEQDADNSMEKVDTTQLKQPELIAHIKAISERHHLLADYYKELIKSSTEKVENYEGNILMPRPNHILLTPDKNLQRQVVSPNLSSGGILNIPLNEGWEDSSSSSDSDSEAYYSCSRSILKHKIVNMETEVCETDEMVEFKKQNQELEEELEVSNRSLRLAEEQIAKLKIELENNDSVRVEMRRLEAQLVSAKNQIKLQEADVEMENKKSLSLHGHIIELEAKFESEKKRVLELQELLSDRDLEIRKLSDELHDSSGNFALEKWQLETNVSHLSERLIIHEARNQELEMQCESLAEEIKKRESENAQMERNQKMLRDEIERISTDLCKKNERVESLNRDLDGLKLKYDMLMAEKNGVHAKLESLEGEVIHRDNQIQRLEYNLSELCSENEGLTAGSESTNRLINELNSRINDLEKEVTRQRGLILGREEEKREAIRQLCFSLNHFKSEYDELRSRRVVHKRATAVV